MRSSRIFKPWLILPPKVLAALLLVLALVSLCGGVYIGFFQTRGFETAKATIVRIDEEPDLTSTEANAKIYTTFVTYTVNGQEYTGELDSYASNYKVGKEVQVKYDPADPTKIYSASKGFAIYLIGIGAALIAASVVTIMKNRQQRTEVKSSKTEQGEAQPLFAPSRQLADEREVYFLTDMGTAKGTCHIEDQGRDVLYEALCDKFSLMGDSLYTFVDREHGREKQYSVGKTLTQSSNGMLALDNHSSFLLDGKDVWKTLHRNGIRIQTGLDGLKWAYTIYRDDAEIARVVNTSKKVHEEDEGGMLSKVPAPGFFRVWTREKNLDAVFLTLFAIGRTDMALYD